MIFISDFSSIADRIAPDNTEFLSASFRPWTFGSLLELFARKSRRIKPFSVGLARRIWRRDNIGLFAILVVSVSFSVK
ncbi:MAG: hypothetical protein ABS69_06100 [Nitrosomonadales bacterium SCN 54-20]|nr:MAG: hypothetical protein ABS69_06100 [Nitrosomonadales bacterium SCN 54-20]